MSYPSFEGVENQPNGRANLDQRAFRRDVDRPRIRRSMRIRVSDPASTDDLAEQLRSRSDAVVERVSEDELEVSLVGSLDLATMQMEIYLRIRAWEGAAEREGVRVDVIPSAGPS